MLYGQLKGAILTTATTAALGSYDNVVPPCEGVSRSTTNTALHILLTVNAAWNIANFRAGLVSALIAAGHKVTVLAPPDDTVDTLVGLGCQFAPLDMRVKTLRPHANLQLYGAFKRHFRTLAPDVIFSFTIKNNTFGALAARSLGIPFIPNITGLGTAFLSGPLLQAIAQVLYKTAFSSVPRVFFQNPDDEALFLKRKLVTPTQAHRLPGSGVDLAHYAFTAPADNRPHTKFLMIARLLKDKGVVEFAEAARLVKAQHPHAQFQLLGALDAENRTAISKDTLEAWVSEGLVEYLGTTNDVRPYIAAADCVVLPSYREGSPRTLMEAAAMGRPLVATNVPGCTAIATAGANGILCESQSAESLAGALTQFLQLPTQQRHAMGAASRQKMEADFGQHIVVGAYIDALHDLNLLQSTS